MNSIELVVEARQRKIDDFVVNRILPYAKRRMVGPFIFLDHVGPATLPPHQGIAIKPHPHIGLATVTYLYTGVLTHRDSLGTVQEIHPGDVNWMTAGRGVVHSERVPLHMANQETQLHGLQTWVALPEEYEDVEPSFFHHAKSTLPTWEQDGVQFCLIAGKAFEKISPVKTFSNMFYIDLFSDEGGQIFVDQDELPGERAIYIIEGSLETEGNTFTAENLVIFKEAFDFEIQIHANTRCLLLGGDPLEGPRFISWNFVSSSQEKIELATSKWKEQAFPPVPEETEFIPLP